MLSMSEFVLANIFGDDVLTERMLIRTFDQLDADGSGEISALELYGYLRKFQADLTPEAVAGFMGDLDRDWDADIGFDEFRQFFPQVKCRSQAIEQRNDSAVKLLGICDDTFKRFGEDVQHWCSEAREQVEKAVAARDIALLDESGAKHSEWVHDMANVVKKVMFLVRNPPTLILPEASMEALRALFEGRLVRKKTTPDDPRGGPLALDNLYKLYKAEWLKVIAAMITQSHVVLAEENKHRKRSDAITLLDDFEVFVKGVLGACDGFMAEQESLLESMATESVMPKLPFARRGMVTVEEDTDAKNSIEKFKTERSRFLEAEKKRQREREEKEKIMQKTDYAAELRGLVWLKKRAAKAEKKTQGQRREEGHLSHGLAQVTQQLNSTMAAAGIFARQVTP
mmetsp:Transcript_87779/g.188304  ORF Transcript_87779/g.188304 Transcript_87779/m.188304 type:complete len:398 (-) Transcript_87779:240-1433(-)